MNRHTPILRATRLVIEHLESREATSALLCFGLGSLTFLPETEQAQARPLFSDDLEDRPDPEDLEEDTPSRAENSTPAGSFESATRQEEKSQAPEVRSGSAEPFGE